MAWLQWPTDTFSTMIHCNTLARHRNTLHHTATHLPPENPFYLREVLFCIASSESQHKNHSSSNHNALLGPSLETHSSLACVTYEFMNHSCVTYEFVTSSCQK